MVWISKCCFIRYTIYFILKVGLTNPKTMRLLPSSGIKSQQKVKHLIDKKFLHFQNIKAIKIFLLAFHVLSYYRSI